MRPPEVDDGASAVSPDALSRAHRPRGTAASPTPSVPPDILNWPGPIADLLHVALAVFDRDMKVVWMNQAMADLFDLERDKTPGRSWYELLPPMRERAPIHARSLSGESVAVEEAVVPFPEGERFFDVRYEPLRDEAGKIVGLLGAGQEVTARVQLKGQLRERMNEFETMNQELKQSLARRKEMDRILTEQKDILQSILDNIPVMLQLYDAGNRLQLINMECERVLGWSLEDWQTLDVLSECFPDAARRQRYTNAMSEASSWWSDFEVRTRDGRVINTTWYPVRLTSGGSIHIGQDVTERRQSERQILEIERALQRRVGHDLHDELGQSLAAVGYMLDQLLVELAAESHPRQAEVTQIHEHVIETMNQMRAIARDLSPVAIVADNLPASLEDMATRVESVLGISCTVTVREPVVDMPSEAANQLYRIAQEAITNAARHGAAKNVEVTLDVSEEEIYLEIVDDGADVPAAIDAAKGLGIRLMNYRSSLIGAQFEIGRNQHGGCSVRVTGPNKA